MDRVFVIFLGDAPLAALPWTGMREPKSLLDDYAKEYSFELKRLTYELVHVIAEPGAEEGEDPARAGVEALEAFKAKYEEAMQRIADVRKAVRDVDLACARARDSRDDVRRAAVRAHLLTPNRTAGARLSVKSLKVAVEMGIQIGEAVKDAEALALAHKATVAFEFNGQTVKVEPREGAGGEAKALYYRSQGL